MDIPFNSVKFPDFWQGEVVSALKSGRDVVLHAPTGAGKTYAFELFYQKEFDGRAVYTVPTRALANDKFREWQSLGWNVGIATGDYSFNTSAPLIVATLETQKFRIIEGNAPDLLVIDEYQLISDFSRGANYEIAIALLPKTCRLLLLSGSVENTEDVVKWLKRLGRDAVLISHDTRPVPLEEIFSEAIVDERSFSPHGAWGRLVRKIVESDMAPLLIFAPKRMDAEIIANKIAEEFKKDIFLDLPREKLSRAGKKLAYLLRRRVAFHHSGLSAFQRANLVEELAKMGELLAVVATTGLGAGVNFSMRSVIIADREYESLGKPRTLRPDELLQMYGRAGRRGLDTSGFAISLPQKPRLSDAKPMLLTRAKYLDWAAIIRVMSLALLEKKSHISAAKNLCSRLFTDERIELGFSNAKKVDSQKSNSRLDASKVEFLNSAGFWERKGASIFAKLGDILYFEKGEFVNFLTSKKAVLSLNRGACVALKDGAWGLKIRIASLAENGKFFVLNKNILRTLKGKIEDCDRALISKEGASLKTIKKRFSKYAPLCFWGANIAQYEEDSNAIFAHLDLKNSEAQCLKDSEGKFLFNPQTRKVHIKNANNFEALSGLKVEEEIVAKTPLDYWLKFGLVDKSFKPTLRGEIFSLFNGAEGLAIAAALEDNSYKLEEIFYDIANLRAGKRFELSSKVRSVNTRLGDVCKLKFGLATLPNYLQKGLPLGYGDGASEIVRKIESGKSYIELEDETLRRGDIERAYLEWKSLVRHIAFCPDLESVRFCEFKNFCLSQID